jgi:hypothetical protein
MLSSSSTMRSLGFAGEDTVAFTMVSLQRIFPVLFQLDAASEVGVGLLDLPPHQLGQVELVVGGIIGCMITQKA